MVTVIVNQHVIYMDRAADGGNKRERAFDLSGYIKCNAIPQDADFHPAMDFVRIPILDLAPFLLTIAIVVALDSWHFPCLGGQQSGRQQPREASGTLQKGIQPAAGTLGPCPTLFRMCHSDFYIANMAWGV